LFNKIDEEIKYHKRGNEVDTEVCNKESIDPELAKEVFEELADRLRNADRRDMERDRERRSFRRM
jgi:hypothetical protein